MTSGRWPRSVIPMEARITDQPAFILRRRDWRNTSLILDLFTRDHGCLSVIARGARRNPAKIAYQPFMLLSLGFSGRGDLKTLTSIEARALPVLERNYLPLLYVNELIHAMLPAGEESGEIFAAYLDLVQASAHEIGEATLRGFELNLLQNLGYFPDISAEAVTGATIEAGEHYQFVVNTGFVGCSASAPDSVSGQVIIDWINRDYGHNGVLRLAKAVLRSTIDFNLHGKTLKSRHVYLEMTRGP